ncbi:MAG TPA: SAM-dependent methyltransferase, partial [Mycobacterium sp.]|nr:SAM-dependent methyltransferase [Mycobacterium sp.]
MARTDNDTWDITESVGATALGVASARAAETESDDPLISDPFARVFLDAVGDGVWNWYSTPQLPPELVQAEPELPLQMQAMVGYMASRTLFFDTFFLDATRAGIGQAVILAAGLDARSWRLPWPDGTTVYELDQPRVLEFKAATLREHGAEPACNRVAVEALGAEFADPERRAQRRARMDRIRAFMAEADPRREIPRTDELWYFEEREDVGHWFGRHGWDVTVTPADQLMAGYGRKA